MKKEILNEYLINEQIDIDKLIDMYKIYVRSNRDIRKYDLLHDYIQVIKLKIIYPLWYNWDKR